MQDAVNTIAHDEPILKRLNVNIGRPALQCVIDDQIYQPDHRCLGCLIFQLLGVAEILFLIARRNVVDDLSHRGFSAAVKTFVDNIEIAFYKQFGDDAFARGRSDCLDRERVCRVRHRQHDFRFHFRHRNGAHFIQKTR